MLNKGYIEETTTASSCCNPLTVVVGRNTRLVDNQHIQYFPYIRRLVRQSQTVEQDNLFIVFDLTRVYHYVSMHVAIPPQIFGIFIQLSQQKRDVHQVLSVQRIKYLHVLMFRLHSVSARNSPNSPDHRMHTGEAWAF